MSKIKEKTIRLIAKFICKFRLEHNLAGNNNADWKLAEYYWNNYSKVYNENFLYIWIKGHYGK